LAALGPSFMNFSFSVEPIEADTGGSYRATDIHVVIDSRQTTEERLHSAFYEILSAYFDPLEAQRDSVLCVADTLIDAWREVGEL